MRGNVIGDDGISSVADGLQHSNTITKLYVSGCAFSVKGSYSYFNDSPRQLAPVVTITTS